MDLTCLVTSVLSSLGLLPPVDITRVNMDSDLRCRRAADLGTRQS
jgi:hypothetical protein